MRQSADLHGQFDDYACQKWDYVVHKQLRWGASLRARRRAVAGLNARFTTFAAGSGLPRPTSLAQLFVNQTIFEDSHIPLRKWLIAWYLRCSSKKGISSLQLQRILEIGCYGTALF